MLGFEESFNVTVISRYGNMNLRAARQIAPEVDFMQSGNGQDMLQLPEVIIRNLSSSCRLAIYAFPAFDLNHRASVGCQPVDAGAQPFIFNALQAGGWDAYAEPALITFSRLRLKPCAASHSGVGFIRFPFIFFLQQIIRALPWVLAHDRGGIGCAYALAAPFEPGGCVLPEVYDCVMGIRQYLLVLPPKSPSLGGL